MLLGIILIICGLLIALYPPLLSIVVACIFIFLGTIITLMSYKYKKMSGQNRDPFLDFFMKL